MVASWGNYSSEQNKKEIKIEKYQKLAMAIHV